MSRRGRAVLWLAVLGMATHAAAAGWEEVERGGHPDTGFVLSRSQGEGLPFPVYRIETHIRASVRELEAAMRRMLSSDAYLPSYQTRRILERGPAGTLAYLYLDIPFVSDRDVTSWVEVHDGEARGSRRFRIQNASDRAPPLPDGVVRITDSWASFDFVPNGERTRVVYETYADFGGSMPAWIVSSNLPGEVKGQIDTLRRALADLRAEGR